MRVSFNWLKEYIDVGLSPEELAERLTMQGLSVDAVERPPVAFRGIVVGRVLSVEKHPNADRLRVCEVDTGNTGERRTIVCGAPNVAAGQFVPVALPGGVLPGERVIGRASLRGVESDGMICSARELGLPDPTEGAGIMVLPELSVGEDLGAALGLDDAVLVLDLTPNYATHCQSMIGVAREVAALLDTAVRLPAFTLPEGGAAAAGRVRVEIEDADLCQRYVARVIEGVRIGPSPLWLQRRLEAAGMRPINNVVDVTNFVMLECGQPLHAFDGDRLRGGAGASGGGAAARGAAGANGGAGPVTIGVRRARPGETLRTLDGTERGLEPDDLIIADGAGPVAIAGVMGGENSEVHPGTINVVLESAAFLNRSVRRTARRFGVRSEAAARFEKWVDPDGCGWAADRAAALIRDLAGGEVLAGAVDVYPRPAGARSIAVRPGFVNSLLGTSLSAQEMGGFLERLELGVRAADGGTLAVTVPARRPDLETETDLAEEVARLHGYDRIPVTMPRSPVVPAAPGGERPVAVAVRHVCLAAGFTEVITYSFLNEALFDRLGLPADDPRRRAIPLLNPLSEDQGVMRTSLLPTMLEVVAGNARRRQVDAALFEVGRVYLAPALPLKELPEERLSLGIVLTGLVERPSWQAPPREADFFFLKGIVEGILEAAGIDGAAFEPATIAPYHPGRCARVLLREGERPLGTIGEIHPGVQEGFDLPARVYAAELDLCFLSENADLVRAYTPLPRFPAVSRDVALVLPETVSAATVAEAIRGSAGPLLAGLTLFDVYVGAGVPAGQRSLAYSLVYQAPDRTLTDDEVEEAHAGVRQALQRLGAQLRS